jgi:hypothetical protein
MIDPSPKARRIGIWVLQILGVLATSHLLERAVRLLPGAADSRVATRLAESAAGDPALRFEEFLRDALLTGTIEELFFRGLVFEIVRRMRGPGTAILTSALLFGLAHGDWHQGVAAGLLGLQLGTIRLFFGLPLAIVAHVTNNALAFWTASHPLPPSLPADWIAVLLSGVACAALLRLWRSAPPRVARSSEPLQTTMRSDE